MSELKGLELRQQACEACGVKPTSEYVASRDGGESGAMFSKDKAEIEDWCLKHPPYKPIQRLIYPAIESDYNVAFPMLMEFCEKRGYLWHIYDTTIEIYCVIYVACGPSGGVKAQLYGSTPCEAIARAIVAAAQEVKS